MEPNTNISNLTRFLIKEKQLDGRLLSWFDAFTSIANLASHKDFPSKKDLKNDAMRSRLLLTFYLGMQLLNELEAIVNPRISLLSDVKQPSFYINNGKNV